MPLYDRKCDSCSVETLDHWEPITNPGCNCATCGGVTNRVWLAKAASVRGDEIDITIKNGLVGENGEPMRFRSREALAKEAKRRGLVNIVEHRGSKGGDKSPHTVKWV